jgi:inner membrane protein
MDNVTHVVTGLMLSRAFIDRGVKRTPLMMMLAANAPDIDALSWAGGTLTYLEYHRAHTHALAFAPVLALLPWLLVKYLGRAPLGLREYLGCLLAVLSHLMLDCTNVYGIRLLLPFSSRWFRLDITDIVDPWIFLTFLIALAAPLLVKLVSDEIGGRRQPPPKRAWAWFAILALLSYEGTRYTLHSRAVAMLSSHLYADQPPRRVTAVPDRLSPLNWRGVVEGDGFVYDVSINVSQDFYGSGGRLEYPAQSSVAIDAAKQTRAFQVFGSFNQLPYWRLSPTGDGTLVELIDLRFGTPSAPRFMATAEVLPGGNVKEARFGMGPVR